MKKLSEIINELDGNNYSETMVSDKIKTWARKWIKKLEQIEDYSYYCADCDKLYARNVQGCMFRKSHRVYHNEIEWDEGDSIIKWLKENILEEKP